MRSAKPVRVGPPSQQSVSMNSEYGDYWYEADVEKVCGECGEAFYGNRQKVLCPTCEFELGLYEDQEDYC